MIRFSAPDLRFAAHPREIIKSLNVYGKTEIISPERLASVRPDVVAWVERFSENQALPQNAPARQVFFKEVMQTLIRHPSAWVKWALGAILEENDIPDQQGMVERVFDEAWTTAVNSQSNDEKYALKYLQLNKYLYRHLRTMQQQLRELTELQRHPGRAVPPQKDQYIHLIQEVFNGFMKQDDLLCQQIRQSSWFQSYGLKQLEELVLAENKLELKEALVEIMGIAAKDGVIPYSKRMKTAFELEIMSPDSFVIQSPDLVYAMLNYSKEANPKQYLPVVKMIYSHFLQNPSDPLSQEVRRRCLVSLYDRNTEPEVIDFLEHVRDTDPAMEVVQETAWLLEIYTD